MAKVHARQSKAERSGRASLPPRWFIVAFWHVHRAVVRATHGHLGLWRPKPDGWGALWLTTTGRRTGRRRQVLVGYFEDGDNLVTMAMNGWGPGEPSWWLNVQAHPDVTVQTRDGVRRVHARRAEGPERDRLLTVMMIVWRFRNNLFHGEKWAYQLQGQHANFTHANAVLMRLLERHGHLAA